MKVKVENLVKTFNFIPLPLVTTDLQGNVITGNKAINTKIALKRINPKYIFGPYKPVFVRNGYLL